MTEISARHLVVVRHGQSEGDVRRNNRDKGIDFLPTKHPVDEEQTDLGHQQSVVSGNWITKFVLEQYELNNFDLCATTPLKRGIQSAKSLGISDEWEINELLTERDRGHIQGMTRDQHLSLYPDNYQQMIQNPFHWVPPGGKSILQMAYRVKQFCEVVTDKQNVLVETHRDWMWASHIPLDGMSIDEVVSINTEEIDNGQIFHYTNVNPLDGTVEDNSLRWKRSVCPWKVESGLEVVETSSHWIKLGIDQSL